MTMHLGIHGDVFTRTQRIVDWIASHTQWPVVTDNDLIDMAGRRFNYPAERLEHFIKTPHGVLSRLTHGTERSMAYLRSVVADTLVQAPTIFHGTMGLLSARRIPRVMNVLITADKDFRVERAQRTMAGTERQIRKTIERMDRREFQWCRPLFGSDHFDADAYDLVVPSDRLDLESTGRLILEHLMQAEMRADADTTDQLADFKLASDIQVLLCESGYPVSVEADKGRVQLTVEQPVLFLNRLAKKTGTTSAAGGGGAAGGNQGGHRFFSSRHLPAVPFRDSLTGGLQQFHPMPPPPAQSRRRTIAGNDKAPGPAAGIRPCRPAVRIHRAPPLRKALAAAGQVIP